MNVRIYVKTGCPYSAGAKRLLDEKGIRYEEINVTDAPERRAEMEAHSNGRTTTPQISSATGTSAASTTSRRSTGRAASVPS